MAASRGGKTDKGEDGANSLAWKQHELNKKQPYTEEGDQKTAPGLLSGEKILSHQDRAPIE